MKCEKCGKRMKNNGGRDVKRGRMRYFLCRCGCKAVTMEKVLAFQRPADSVCPTL